MNKFTDNKNYDASSSALHSHERGNSPLVESLMHTEPRPFQQTPYIEETIHYSLIVWSIILS